jgi:hypothetical protein
VNSVETSTAGSQAEDLVRTEMTWKGPATHCLQCWTVPHTLTRKVISNICIRV